MLMPGAAKKRLKNRRISFDMPLCADFQPEFLTADQHNSPFSLIFIRLIITCRLELINPILKKVAFIHLTRNALTLTVFFRA
jgi:hypothetical protein